MHNFKGVFLKILSSCTKTGFSVFQFVFSRSEQMHILIFSFTFFFLFFILAAI